jgi:hypothetical protein
LNSLLEAALAGAREGALILPLWWTDGQGVCQCPKRTACSSPGKHPLITHGLDDASDDLGAVERWWHQWPQANIGVRTDKEPRVDIDLLEVAQELAGDTALSLQTEVVSTPRGGLHLSLATETPDDSRTLSLDDGRKLGELKAARAYVLVPPSSIGGKAYKRLSPKPVPPLRVDDPLEWLQKLLSGFGLTLAVGQPHGRRDYEALASTVYEGQGRHNALTSYAGHIWIDGMAPEALVGALRAVNAAQCRPPLPDGELRAIAEHFVERRERRGSRASNHHDALTASGGQREIMVTDRQLHAIAEDGWDALLAGNSPPLLFRHGGVIAEIGVDDDGRARISHLTLPGLRGRLDRSADWLRRGKEGPRPAWPPKEVVEDMLAIPQPLPVLRGVVKTPVFAANGSLLTDAGYQPDTGLFYEPSGEPLPAVPEEPDATDLQRAKEIIRLEWLSDFPFVDESSCANAVGAPLTAAARELIDGPTPLFAIDCPVPGTGKGLLAHGIGIIALGAPPAVMTETRNEEEMRKRITSSLCAGLPVVLLDNIKRPLQSSALAAALTARHWSDRILGRNQIVELPIRCVWLTTGNNLQLDNEIARRTVWVRLDARVDRPWQRTSFRHPDLPAWLQRHRHELVWAFLVLVQNWIALGRPAWKGVPLGSYEAWSSVIGGILEAAGIGGFLENREELYARTDAETEEWRLFVGAWWEAHSETPVKARDLYALCRDRDLLPSIFAGAKDDASDRALTTRLGLALRQRRDRCFGDLVVRSQTDSHQKATMYRLEPSGLRDGEANVPQISANVPQEDADSQIQLRDVRYLAGPFSDLRARGESPEQDVEGTASNVPQRPAGPADRFKAGADPAGPALLMASNVPQDVPQPRTQQGEATWEEEVP